MQRGIHKRNDMLRIAMYCGGFALLCAVATILYLFLKNGSAENTNSEASEVEETVDEWSNAVTTQLWIVNEQRTLPLSYEPEQMVAIRASNVMLVNEAATAFSIMINDMEEPVVPANGYISSSAQQNLYDRIREEYLESGYTEERIKIKIRAEYMPGGQDEHQLGMTVDVCEDETLVLNYDFQKTPQGRWLAENAWKYGFVYRDMGETDVIYKPWQLRYVGKVHAYNMQELGYSIEEYLDFLKEQETYYVSVNDENLVIYYRNSLQGIPHRIKEVTGDNAGNYVVTCYQK